MSQRVVDAAANRIAQHVEAHNLDSIAVVFHGGEPLLVGAARISGYVKAIRNVVSCSIDFGVQTNATLLTEEILSVLEEHRVSVGISFDGDQEANDRNRVFHDGRGAYAETQKGISLLCSRPAWRRLFAGVLAVVDLRNSPLDVYRAIAEINPPSMDVLLPDCHHDSPPPRPLGDRIAYGRWLAKLFDIWYEEQPSFDIRYFAEIMSLMLGGQSTLETIGDAPADMVVIETNGDIEPVDTLKIVGVAATNIGRTVSNTSFDDVIDLPAFRSRLIGKSALCDTCQKCPEVDNCGGGYLPHRFGKGNGFLNPSVYCADLQYLFEHMRQRIAVDLPTVGQVDVHAVLVRSSARTSVDAKTDTNDRSS